MASAGSKTIFIISILLFLLTCSSTASNANSCAQTSCKDYTFNNGKSYDSCIDLPVLGAYLHWTYRSSDKTVHVAYRAKQQNPKGWISWGLNLNGQGMVGTQALVAYGTDEKGSSVKAVKTPIDGYHPDMQERELSFSVCELSAEYCNGEMTVFAKLGPLDGTTSFNHVWQVGDSVSGTTPTVHSMNPDNKNAKGTIDFCTGGR